MRQWLWMTESGKHGNCSSTSIFGMVLAGVDWDMKCTYYFANNCISIRCKMKTYWIIDCKLCLTVTSILFFFLLSCKKNKVIKCKIQWAIRSYTALTDEWVVIITMYLRDKKWALTWAKSFLRRIYAFF